MKGIAYVVGWLMCLTGALAFVHGIMTFIGPSLTLAVFGFVAFCFGVGLRDWSEGKPLRKSRK